MGADGKLMRAYKKFCRCPVGHNQENCSINTEIRPARTRAQDKREWLDEVGPNNSHQN